ncbi:hypothetical protein L2E82_24453 [Cichorium intybus]|uniref:Uncharacterized protein n=1 Tax=Cichorium intybus TaxID=13427 RepID=A0ACB9E132_CICIN|nr:hypothetical protein L2E82_24453 [Cichorium intybus]
MYWGPRQRAVSGNGDVEAEDGGRDHSDTHRVQFCWITNCKKIMEMVQDVAESQQPEKEENKDASNVAGLLENLTVEDMKEVKEASAMH